MRILHTMIRVSDLEKSIKFYCEIFEMKLLRRKDYPAGKFTLAFIGYGEEADNTVLELTHNWGKTEYQLGDAFGHIAIEVDDVYSACETIKKRGGEVVREAGPMKSGETVIAFVKDPDGYLMELIGKKSLIIPKYSQSLYMPQSPVISS